MRATAVFAYLAFPALAYLVLSGAEGGVAQAASFFLPNYLWYAAPHLTWFAVATVVRAQPRTVHAGLLGATIALVSTLVAFECCINNSSGLGWLLYWPFAFVVVLAAVGLELYLRPRAPAVRPKT
jgi:hypothetical protein